MRRYPKYKDSGINWLGEIPEHWEVKKLKYIGKSIMGIIYSPSEIVINPEQGILVLRASNIQNGKLSLLDNVYVNKEIDDKLKTEVGDILICSRSGSIDLIGKNILIDEKSKGNTFGAFMLIFRTILFPFVYHYLNSQVFKGQIGLFQTVTINQLTINVLNNFMLAVSPVKEQNAIANYLNQKTNQIDTFIKKKQTQIDLLKEYRKAIINEAIAKGLNPNVKMKDSGIEWLGKIPEHWEITQLKYQTQFINGAAFKPIDWSNHGIPIIRIENLNGGDNFNFFNGQIDIKYYVNKGDLLFAWSGNKGTSFGPFIWERDGLHYLNQHIFRLEDYSFHKKYFYWLLKAVTSYVEYKTHGIIGLVHITKQELGNIKILSISSPEQQAISNYLDQKTSQIDDSIEKLENQIHLLQQYRTSLISEVVTGKIDIRDEVQ